MKPRPPNPPPTRLVAERPALGVMVGLALLVAIIFTLLFMVIARADDNTELCERGARIMVDGFKQENPNLASDFFHLENVKVAFPTTEGVICQADFVFSDPRLARRTDTYPVHNAEDGKIKVCNRQGKCTPPQ